MYKYAVRTHFDCKNQYRLTTLHASSSDIFHVSMSNRFSVASGGMEYVA